MSVAQRLPPQLHLCFAQTEPGRKGSSRGRSPRAPPYDIAYLEGFEPATHGLEGRCSIRLSYRYLKRVMGIEPTCPAWKAGVLPLNYTRERLSPLERRRRDLNPCAAVNDLLPFQGSPFGQLGYFSESIKHAIIMQVSGRPFKCLRGGPARGEGGIRTHAPLRTNGFQDRLVMTTSIPLRIERFHQTQVKSYQMKASLSTKKAVDNARVFG